MLGVRQHGADNALWIPLLAKDRRAVLRMLVQRGVNLVVEIVQQRRHAPELLVLAEAARVRGGRGLDGERVPPQRLALRVAGEGLPGAFAADLRHAPETSAVPGAHRRRWC